MATGKSEKSVTKHMTKKTAKTRIKSNNRLATNPAVRRLVKKIKEDVKVPDQATVKISSDLRQLRAQVEKEALLGGNTWLEWARKAFRDLDVNMVRLLNDLAGAPDEEHRAILLAHRADGAKRTRRWRKKQKENAIKAARMAIERKWLIRWAKAAPHKDVIRAWKHVKKTYDA
jgi:hypothetical protein